MSRRRLRNGAAQRRRAKRKAMAKNGAENGAAPEGKKPRGSNAFKRFFNAWRVLSGVELVHKIIKGQFGLPDSFGTDPFQAFQQN